MPKSAFTAALWILLLAGQPAFASPDAPIETRTRTATAYHVEDGGVLYREVHVETWRGALHESSVVEYRSATGELLATKTMAYGPKRLMPTVRFEDVRTGAEERIRWTGTRLIVGFRPSRGETLETRELRMPKLAAADAGFDKAVQEHWAKLAAGTPLTFGFAVPAKLDFFRLTLEKTGGVERDGRELVQFEMSPNNVFLNLIVDSVVLLYDAKTRSLVEYLGRSNIRSADGSIQDARIVFAPCESTPGALGIAPSSSSSGSKK